MAFLLSQGANDLIGVAIDLLVYSIIIPVIPFRLEELGYHSVSALTAWLLFSYVGPYHLLSFQRLKKLNLCHDHSLLV